MNKSTRRHSNCHTNEPSHRSRHLELNSNAIGHMSDDEAERLATLHYNPAFKWIASRGVSDPGDVVAYSMLRALERFDPTLGAFESVFYRIIRNKMVDWFRKSRRSVVLMPLPDDVEVVDANPVPDPDWEVLTAELTDVWRSMDPLVRRLIFYHYFEGLSFEEIHRRPDIVGCRIVAPTLRSKVWRACRDLKAIFASFRGVPFDVLANAIGWVACSPEFTAPPTIEKAKLRRGRRVNRALARCTQRRKSKAKLNPPNKQVRIDE